jgi:dTMP kinase
MEDMTELFLFSASRSQLVNEVIQPALEQGAIVLCDRFYDSTTAYQGWGRGISLDAIKTINLAAAHGLVPDITYFLDIPVGEVERRMQKQNSSADRMESSGREFYERVRNGFLHIAGEDRERFMVLDGLRPIDEVQNFIRDRFEQVRAGSKKQYSG